METQNAKKLISPNWHNYRDPEYKWIKLVWYMKKVWGDQPNQTENYQSGRTNSHQTLVIKPLAKLQPTRACKKQLF